MTLKAEVSEDQTEVVVIESTLAGDTYWKLVLSSKWMDINIYVQDSKTGKWRYVHDAHVPTGARALLHEKGRELPLWKQALKDHGDRTKAAREKRGDSR